MAKRVINPNLRFLHHSLKNNVRGTVLEGSSRSAKTWSSLDFIIYLCSRVETGSTINILKETYKSFKTTIYEDINRRWPQYGMVSPIGEKQEVAKFNLFGNTINFLGADSETTIQGVGCDYLYVNEALDIPQAVFDQAEMRCRKMWWMDYNPKFTDHWVYKSICRRPDVAFLKTTFLDNPFISEGERNKILGYEPTHPEDRHLPENKRRPHPVNIAAGTASDYMWNVYGLGLRSAPEGVIFQHVVWINEFPTDLEDVYYGLDFGQTQSPTALVKVGVNKKLKHLYLQKLHYHPTPAQEDVDRVLATYIPGKVSWADSAMPGFISGARRAGHDVYPVKKFHGSINYGLTLMKNYRIHIVDCPEWRLEQSGYLYRSINGIRLDEPEDANNHLWDAARYAVMSNLQPDS